MDVIYGNWNLLGKIFEYKLAFLKMKYVFYESMGWDLLNNYVQK